MMYILVSQLNFFYYKVVLIYYFMILFCYNKVVIFQYRFINCLIEQNFEKKINKILSHQFFFSCFFSHFGGRFIQMGFFPVGQICRIAGFPPSHSHKNTLRQGNLTILSPESLMDCPLRDRRCFCYFSPTVQPNRKIHRLLNRRATL